MRTIILVFLCLGMVAIARSQTLTVTDKETGLPLELVTIASEQPKAFARTNAQGRADIAAFAASEQIVFRMVGYQTALSSFAALEQAGYQISLSPTQFSLDQVVVSATRWNQAKRDIPARITTVSPREVALQNPQTAADMLGSQGEIFIQKSQSGGGSPMIRGFSTNRLLYTVDGVRMNTAIFRSGNLQNVISLDPFAIENTEVMFGPGSLIYGSDAIGAVMSFQTLMPQFALGEEDEVLTSGKSVLRYSSANNEQTVHFDVNVGWRKWAMRTSFTSSDYGDLRMGSTGPEEYLRPFYAQRIDTLDVIVANPDPQVQTPTAYSQINLMQKLRFSPDENWDFQYGFHYSTTTDYSRYDRHIRLRNGLPRSAEWNYGPQVWMMNNLNVSHSSANMFYNGMSIRLAQQYFEESRIDRDFNGDMRFSRLEEVGAYSFNLDFQKVLDGVSQLYYGLEVVHNDVHSSGSDENIRSGEVQTGPSRYPRSTWASYAAYLSYQRNLSRQVLVQGGLRYNRFMLDADFSNNLPFYPFPFSTAEINNGALTGSIGAVYHADNDWSLSANLSTGFRSPNVDDIGKVFDSEPGSVVIPNPDLNAEFAYNGEIGIAKVFSDRVKVDITGYYTLLQDALVRRDFTLNGQDSIMYNGTLSQVQAVQNAARAEVYGVQAGVEIKLGAGFGFATRLNYQKGEEELDDGSTSPSRHAAPLFGLSRISYRMGELDLQLNAQYSAEKSFDDLPAEEQGKDYLYAIDENGKPYSPAWYTLNLKANYQLNETFAISAGVENLTDQRYRPYSSGIAAAGRNVVMALRAGF